MLYHFMYAIHLNFHRFRSLSLVSLHLHDDQSASYCLGKFLSLLSHLTDLKIDSCSFHEWFLQRDCWSSFFISGKIYVFLMQKNKRCKYYYYVCLEKGYHFKPEVVSFKGIQTNCCKYSIYFSMLHVLN